MPSILGHPSEADVIQQGNVCFYWRMQTPSDEGAATDVKVQESKFFLNVAGPSFSSIESQSTQEQRSSWGGALYMGSETSILVALGRARGKIYCQLMKSEFIENGATNGGAISSVHVARVSVKSTNFTRNSAVYGGALYVKSVGDPDAQIYVFPENYMSVRASLFDGNKAHQKGGALFLLVSPATAPLEIAGVSPLDISNITMAGSLNNNEDDVFFESSGFEGNYASTSGGAWHIERGRAGCRDCTFMENSANRDAGFGGAISLMDQAALHGRSLSMAHNKAHRGAAVFCHTSLIDVVKGNIDHNTAQKGGGLYIHVPEATKFRFGLFARINVTTFNGNEARFGGAYWILHCLCVQVSAALKDLG